MAQNRLILDTDGGVDDAQALLLLIANGRAPDAITTVFGNVSLASATRNILTTLAVAGADIPVYGGAAQPLVQPIIDATHIHGEDGLGGAPRLEVFGDPHGDDAVQFLRETLLQAAMDGEKVDILTIGPLTNLALVLHLEPKVIAGIGRLIIMGGTLNGRGNTTPAAEFNIYADPEAASIVFGSDIETVVVPWETCATHQMQGQEIEEMFAGVGDSAGKRFSQALANQSREIVKSYTGMDIMRFVDPLAAAVAIDPAIVTRSLTASVKVALAPGITRGMTVVDPSRRLGTPPVVLVEAVDLDRMKELYRASVGELRLSA
ncbi:nucleoside hydrolase [Consotaella salsifontis]|uniref:Purine nucleosidase/non-specific riboncleoside hydrolase n=1 Tax=Consotaella salsifontis TaxID=1365950 RepID=A0A1T4MQZ2_9HYPH|nr:nucleoside hydrolase [Consotaella salsifontis]SJZ69205.1 purine nucleosidase/non-specific riboncleoside hydrolase [Consotaella salsifontis]